MKTPLPTEGQTIEDTHKIPHLMLPTDRNYLYNYVDVAKFWMKSGVRLIIALCILNYLSFHV